MTRIFHSAGEVLESRPLGAAHHWLLLRAPEPAAAARPGQFLHCAPSAHGDFLLRRPVSISGVRASLSSETPDSLELSFRVIGAGTRALAAHKAGETIDCLGPLGNGFTMAAEKPSLLIAGGMGIAPLRWLAQELAARGGEVTLLAGAKSAEDFPYPVVWEKGRGIILEFAAFGIATEFVSEEQGVLVTELAAQRLPELLAAKPDLQAYAVGPRGMLRALLQVLPEDLPCQVSLEERMACGIGACRSCVVALRQDTAPGYGYFRVCYDGPVFDLRAIAWEREQESG